LGVKESWAKKLLTLNHKNLFISFNNVSLRLNDRIIFPNTNWEFYNDEHWAIIGTNGSGKSILVRALSGQIPVVQGKIVYHFLKNRPQARFPNKDTSPRHAISYVCFDKQRQALARKDRIYQARWHSSESADALSVSDYLSVEHVYNINPFQVDAWRPDPDLFKSEIEHVIVTLSIQALIKKKMIHLSNGETRKVMLARALLTRPRLLVLENPFTGLDQQNRNQLKTILENLMNDDMRLVIVSSRQDEILPGITHVMMIENQKIITTAPKEEVLEHISIHKIWKNHSSMTFNLTVPQKPEMQPDYKGGQVLVEMKEVNISYNGVPVLRNIDWKIKKGEHWALMGPNGSGKTTLLSLILGDNPQAYANDITLFGKRKGTGENIWEIKQKIGFVSSELHIHFPPNISGFDAVCSGFFDSVGLYRRCSQEQQQIAKLWMENLGLLDYKETLFDKLSHGLQRLLLIARALVKQPLLLIMDEPCQGLDQDNRQHVLNLVDSIGNRLDTTVIFVTHDIDELPGIITNKLTLSQSMDRNI
jgi:molybdate transport system ATP-binding protein